MSTTPDARPLRIGLVGAGGIAECHLPHLARLGAEVVVFSEAGAEELVARHGTGRVVGSLEELLAAVDVVDVITPTPTHTAVVTRALEAGKDVICEKPVARTADDAAALADLAERLGRRLYPAHVVRYFPEYAALHAAVARGDLGDLAVLRFTRSGAYPTRTPWFADVEASGGIILDQMVHDIDIATWLAGPVVSVSAVSTHSAPGAGRSGEPAAAAHVLLTHAGGAVSQVNGFWGPAHLQFTTSFSVTGTAGSLEHSSAAERAVVSDLGADTGAGALVPDTDPLDDPYFLELRELVAALSTPPGEEATPGSPRITAREGAEAVRVANAAIEAARTGTTIHLTEQGARA